MLKIVHEFPAYRLYEPKRWMHYKDGDVIALPYTSMRGDTLFNFYTLGSVAGYAIKNSECPERALARARERGHPLWWANANAVCIHNGPHVQEQRPVFAWGDEIRFHGRMFKLEKAPNQNCKLVLMGTVDEG